MNLVPFTRHQKAQKLGSDEEAIRENCIKLFLEGTQIDKEQSFRDHGFRRRWQQALAIWVFVLGDRSF